MFVKHGKGTSDDDEFDSKVIYFREILGCNTMPAEKVDECKSSRYYPQDKPYPFVLRTLERKFELCA